MSVCVCVLCSGKSIFPSLVLGVTHFMSKTIQIPIHKQSIYPGDIENIYIMYDVIKALLTRQWLLFPFSIALCYFYYFFFKLLLFLLLLNASLSPVFYLLIFFVLSHNFSSTVVVVVVVVLVCVFYLFSDYI